MNREMNDDDGCFGGLTAFLKLGFACMFVVLGLRGLCFETKTLTYDDDSCDFVNTWVFVANDRAKDRASE